MKKGLSTLSTIGLLVLTGCSSPSIVYDGQEMTEREAEERIADKLEVENPDLDLEITITRETDD